ncbi:MAG: SDR family oxidoreductase [Gammaproteobacteria bacterium]|nr:SDR family oxidoreductase [Gammaproteobacteria bacterium]NIR83144.1 SDR family oxidoreductase [Gammaproteobacteria bacterium]NIR90952.1 SDR family oxidoreductase [Gammaproteobacteria bacterium]NIU04309.1 SDR family oxidoreductase [Gammaproteobacteria bacterium]NIV52532.1 SDR family oxidoreductase [Gammaproteobacteria bacterium]
MAITVDFSGKAVVVVGGTSGINRGVAEAFAAHGAKVAVASRKQDKVDDTVMSLQRLGAEAMGFTADVREPDAVEAGLDTAHQRLGDFDVVVSGAAGNFPALANDLSWNGFKSVVDIDLRGTFHVMKAAFPRLKKPDASVINISAPQAFIPTKAQIHVCAAKAGVDMITRTLALEWGPSGVRVNSIVPGPIEGTEGMARLAPHGQAHRKVIDGVPLGRYGTAADIAHACLFLSSELASYITGAVLLVDGGWAQNYCGGMGDDLAALAARNAAR